MAKLKPAAEIEGGVVILKCYKRNLVRLVGQERQFLQADEQFPPGQAIELRLFDTGEPVARGVILREVTADEVINYPGLRGLPVRVWAKHHYEVAYD